MGVIKGTSPKTLKQRFRLTAKEQGRQKKYVPREKTRHWFRRCLLGLLHGELRQFPFTDWKKRLKCKPKVNLISYLTNFI